MANSPMPLYWDTDVFIHRFQRTPEHIAILEQLTDAAERGEIVFVQSTFTVAELVKDPESGEKLPDDKESLIEDFFENEFVVIRTLTEPIAFLSRKISRDYGVKPGDAVHVATALFWKVPILHTYDKKLLNKNGLIGDSPLRIELPTWVGQTRLLFEGEGSQEVKDEGSETGAGETIIAGSVVAEPRTAVSLRSTEGSEKAEGETDE